MLKQIGFQGLTYNDVLKMVFGAVVLELNVKAVLNSYFHLNTVVKLGRVLCRQNKSQVRGNNNKETVLSSTQKCAITST